ncbi:MAG: hypothetical protein EPO36_08655 [Chloroflexota bacterium]|nr:MAG: hypothetical protein EPO36_08655 [Chloroflexota bacterium]
MLNIPPILLLHRHRDGSSHPMAEAEPSAASLDPERELRAGARIYACKACDEQIVVTTGTSDPKEAQPPA